MERLGAVSLGDVELVSSGSRYKGKLARVDLELRSLSSRAAYSWSALVGFSARHESALWGQTGFLEHFLATFNTRDKRLTLRPNGTFPNPLYTDH
jgi:hypothetical protein